VDECPVVQIFLNVAQDAASIRRLNQSRIGALPDGRPKLKPMQWGEPNRVQSHTPSMAKGGCRVVVGDVEGDQVRSVVASPHRRDRLSTSATPGIGFGDIRLSLNWNSAADLPRLGLLAGTNLTQGLPELVINTATPANTISPSVSNFFAASRFVTVFTPTKLISRTALGKDRLRDFSSRPSRLARFLPAGRLMALGLSTTESALSTSWLPILYCIRRDFLNTDH
jgi:hypothetical protein